MNIDVNNNISLDERKRISFDILCYIDDWCKKNNVKYFLAYGTLLGAVRHHGFIPWDDDIDIIMFYDDYMKFINEFNNSSIDVYKCLSFENGTFYLPYSKVVNLETKIISENFIDLTDLGIGVDIFLINNIENEKELKKIYLDLKKLRYSLYNNYKEVVGNKIFSPKVCFYSYSKIFGWKFWSNKIRKKIKKHYSKNKNYYFSVGALSTGDKNIYEKNWFDETTEIVFEGKYFPVPKEYEKILNRLYGDYMSLPPIEKRISHLNTAFFRSKEIKK